MYESSLQLVTYQIHSDEGTNACIVPSSRARHFRNLSGDGIICTQSTADVGAVDNQVIRERQVVPLETSSPAAPASVSI